MNKSRRSPRKANAGLVLMHLRGDFETMHKQPLVETFFGSFEEFSPKRRTSRKLPCKTRKHRARLSASVSVKPSSKIWNDCAVEFIARRVFRFPLVIGASRKSFIGKILNDAPVEERLQGSLAAAAIAVWNGANIVRVHDVRATVETLKVVDRIKGEL
jgi:dihydropteroate synthase